MRFFNKIIACLIMTSFIFASEGFAVKRTPNEDRRSLPIKPRLKRAPVKKRASITRLRKAGIRKPGTQRSEAVRKRQSITRRPAEKKRPAPAARRQAQKNITHRPVEKKRPAQTVRATAKQKVAATPPVKTSVAKNAKAAPSPSARKPIPLKAKQKAPSTAPARYLIKTSEMPMNIRTTLKAEGFEGQQSVTPQDLRILLAKIKEIDPKFARECSNFLKAKHGFQG